MASTRVYLTSKSLTYAQRSVRVLERAGISAAVARAPREISARGCGYAVLTPERTVRRAVPLLQAAGIPPERVYRRGEDGAFEEVAL